MRLRGLTAWRGRLTVRLRRLATWRRRLTVRLRGLTAWRGRLTVRLRRLATWRYKLTARPLGLMTWRCRLTVQCSAATRLRRRRVNAERQSGECIAKAEAAALRRTTLPGNLDGARRRSSAAAISLCAPGALLIGACRLGHLRAGELGAALGLACPTCRPPRALYRAL